MHSYPYKHHRHRLFERKHMHIVELGLTLLAQANLPLQFWWDVFHNIVYHINRLPSTVLQFSTLYETLFKYKPVYNILKYFGYSCYPYLRYYKRHKLDFHTSKCIFVGYSSSRKGYKCLHS